MYVNSLLIHTKYQIIMTNGLFFGEINKEEDGRLTIELTDKEIVGIVCGKGGVERGEGRGEVHKGRQKGLK